MPIRRRRRASETPPVTSESTFQVRYDDGSETTVRVVFYRVLNGPSYYLIDGRKHSAGEANPDLVHLLVRVSRDVQQAVREGRQVRSYRSVPGYRFPPQVPWEAFDP
jgi:hypothetical protein